MPRGPGWFGEPRRHSNAAKLGWKRRDRAGGRRLDYLKHLGKRGKKKVNRGAKYIGSRTKKGAKFVGRHAIQAGKEVGGEWKKTV